MSDTPDPFEFFSRLTDTTRWPKDYDDTTCILEYPLILLDLPREILIFLRKKIKGSLENSQK